MEVPGRWVMSNDHFEFRRFVRYLFHIVDGDTFVCWKENTGKKITESTIFL